MNLDNYRCEQTCNGQIKVGVLEFVDHAPYMVLDLEHLLLNNFNLALFGFDLVLHSSHFFFKVFLYFGLVFIVHCKELFMALDLSLNVLVLLIDHVNLTVEHIDIVEE